MKKFISFMLLSAITFAFSSCFSKIRPNTFVVSTNDSWNNVSVEESGTVFPYCTTPACDYVVLSKTENVGDAVVETKMKNKVSATISLAYRWVISEPITFVKNAKKLTNGITRGEIDPLLIEEYENSVIDKYASDVLRQITPNLDPRISEAELEVLFIQGINDYLKDKGMKFLGPSLNIQLSKQTESALDILAALEIFESAGMKEFGEKIILSQAGATQVEIQNILDNQKQTE